MSRVQRRKKSCPHVMVGLDDAALEAAALPEEAELR